MAFEDIPDRPSDKTPIWHPKGLGDYIEGVIIHINDNYGGTTKKSGKTQVTLKTKDGEFRTPSPLQLLQKLEDARLEVGYSIKITLRELKDTGQTKPMQLFDVAVNRVKQTVITAPLTSQDEELKPLIEQLAFAAKVYPDGMPQGIFFEMCHGVPATIQKLKDKGIVFENKPAHYKVVV